MKFTLPALLLLLAVPALAQNEGYYRFPASRGDAVFFTAEGDLWTAPLAGGVAARLTSHPAEETRVAVSPDGRWLAFSAAYEGPVEAYVMPVSGGLPRRVSFDGLDSLVLGWTPRGEVLVSTQNPSGPPRQRVIARVAPETLARTVLPVVDVTEGCLDDSSRVLFFTRLGTNSTGDHARHYRGGAAPALWRFDIDGRDEAEPVPFDSPAKRPMWWRDRLYFVSDRDGCDNLWSMGAGGEDPRQLTHHRRWGVREASLGDGCIVYQSGADVRVFDLESSQDRMIPLTLRSDFDQRRKRLLTRPLEFLESARLSFGGDRLVLTARGQVAVAGPSPLRRASIALPPGTRAREAVLGRDPRWVFLICDQGGEEQVWRFPADGTPGGVSLTSDPQVARVGLYPSPRGDRIAHTDRLGRLFLLNLDNGENTLLETSPVGEPAEVVWAPGGRTLAIVRPANPRRVGQILLRDVASGRQQVVTSDRYESYAPAFSPDGHWLYFLSERSFQVTQGSPWGDRNMGPHFDRRSRLYALALQPRGRFPFQPPTELDPPPGAGPSPSGEKKAESPGARGPLAGPAIVWDGLSSRLFEVPLPPGNYQQLATDGQRLYLLEREGDRSLLKTLPIGGLGAPAEVFAPDVRGFELSADGRKLLLVRGRDQLPEFLVVETGARLPGDLAKATVRLDHWELTVDPMSEWRQMFADAWRMHRDRFFDSGLRGVDWTSVRQRFLPLVERLTDRAELDDLLGQMIGELGALHSQLRPGDLRKASDSPQPAFLGAELSHTPQGARIDRILRGEAELPGEAGPLSVAGLDLREGDVIEQVNGRPVAGARDIADLLAGQAGQQVLLLVRRGSAVLPAVVVVPVTAERQQALRYADWEEGRRRRVEEAGGGAIGYLHLRAMGPGDIASFAREFYAQYDRAGLIIDVRRNLGGNIDSWILEKLLRRAWAFWTDNRGATNGTNMQQTFRGHLVVLIDELTYSDGETFAAGIRALGLGSLVGRRTAGAGVWLTDRNRLLDGGMARVAEWPQFAVADRRWLIEGVGVAPDVEVANPPHETFLGKDRQLEAAIKLVRERIARQPVNPLKGAPIPPLPSGGGEVAEGPR